MLCNIVRNVGAVRNIRPLLQRWSKSPLIVSTGRKFSDNKPEFEDKPIRYSTSKAANWRASYSRMPPSTRLYSEPIIVMACLAVFLVYFCMLREENDIDDMVRQAFPRLFEESVANLPKPDQKKPNENVKPTT